MKKVKWDMLKEPCETVYMLCLCSLCADLHSIEQFQRLWFVPSLDSALGIISQYKHALGCDISDFRIFLIDTRLIVRSEVGFPSFNACPLDLTQLEK